MKSCPQLKIHLGVTHLSSDPSLKVLVSQETQKTIDNQKRIEEYDLDLDQNILPHTSCLFLLLQDGGLPWSQWQRGWKELKNQEHSTFDPTTSLGVKRDLSWQHHAYYWIETWINAASMLQGGVISVQHLKTLHPSDPAHIDLNQDGIVLYFPLSTLEY
jgi:hypothetical protein